jgi:hypothetical protein
MIKENKYICPIIFKHILVKQQYITAILNFTPSSKDAFVRRSFSERPLGV